MFSRLPIRWRLSVGSALLTFVILLAFGGMIGFQLSDRLRRDWTADTSEAANTLATQLAIVSTPAGFALRGVDIDDFAAAQHAHVRILSWTGNRIDDTADAPDVGITGEGSRSIDGQLVETRYVEVTPSGFAIIQYSRPLQAIDRQILGVWLLIALGVLGGAALALLAGLAVARQAMRPVASMTAAARRIGDSGALDERIPVPRSRDEIQDLALTLTGALDSLDEARRTANASLERQREFVADASHELRTPLTSLIARLELLSDGTSGEAREDADAALRSARRMADLVRDLLTLARADGQLTPPGLVSTGELVEEAISDAASPLEGHALSVSTDGSELLVERRAVSRAIRNLIENACTHGPASGAISVEAGASGSGWECAVSDQGEGIPPSMRGKVLERFARVGGDSAGSTGLGLAIVSAVAEAHGGTVAVSESPNGGARVAIRLPADVVRASGLDHDRHDQRPPAEA